MRVVNILNFLLLSSSISIAHSNQRKGSSASNSIVSSESLVSKELSNASSEHIIKRDEHHRTEKFMKHFAKGASLWDQYMERIQDPTLEDTSIDFPFEKDPFSTDKKNPPLGWKWGPNQKGENAWLPVSVDRDGWRFYRSENMEVDEVVPLGLTDVDAEDIKLKTYEAVEWRNPDFFMLASADCENGIFVGHSSYFKIDQKESEYRWSDVAWRLWKEMCPNREHRLQFFIGETIENEESRAIFEEAATARGQFDANDFDFSDNQITTYNPSQNLEWEMIDGKKQFKCNEEAGECDFYSIIHSPVAIGKVYFLRDHGDELLGHNYISEIVTQSQVGETDSGLKIIWDTMFRVEELECW